ncbi:MAG: hypothetical protein EU536_00665 [Promethearchaeota archaeon]|nr:MAG: hypothetical protein EU536_00665 [Candidatus Lokiarchaeota archaeon]
MSFVNPIEKVLQLIKNLELFTEVKGAAEIHAEVNNLLRDIYDLFMGLESFNRKKRLALLKLAHLFPKTLTTADLRNVMEYSDNTSLSYVRNEIQELETANLIIINKYKDKKLPFQIQINHNHKLMRLLIALTTFGTHYKEMIREQVEEI